MKKNTPKTELLYKKSIAIDQLDINSAINLMLIEQKSGTKSCLDT